MPILTTAVPALTEPTLFEQIVARRYQAEVAGFIWNGFYIASDRESQTKLDSASRAATKGLRVENSVWKCGNPLTGEVLYRETSNAEIIEIADMGFHYVQACFSREAELVAASKLPQFDPQSIHIGWP